MKTILIASLFLIVMLADRDQSAHGQLYPSQPPLFQPFTPNAYGPGINSDATGRPFYWQATPQQQGPDVTIQPNVNQYGYGQSGDQYGRPIAPQMQQERRSGFRSGFGRHRQDDDE